jgi:hypothetical protein
MKKIQKVYLMHDYFYASLYLIPLKSFDGKDHPKEVYIHTDRVGKHHHSMCYFFY